MANVLGSNRFDFVSTVFKTRGVDTLTSDTVFGRLGNDRLYGEAGADTLFGNDGRDRLDGGAGNDDLFGDEGRDRLIGRAGNDRLFGGPDDDVSIGGAGNDFIQDDTGDDRLAGRDRLYGGAGNDFMRGIGGNDFISGGAGNDAVIGDGGDDCLKGGTGADGFIFERPVQFSVSRTDNDVILDFTQGQDRIRLLGFAPDAARFEDLDIRTQGGSSVIELSALFETPKGTHTITVLGVTDLGSGDFLFG
jgi:Ca2+-binding RTX toxin-like protein